MIFCVWLLAFSPQLCEQLRRYNVVPALSDILQESVKEKVTRIILAAFRVCVMKSVCFKLDSLGTQSPFLTLVMQLNAVVAIKFPF